MIGFWTADKIAQLTELWGKDLRASVIAKTMEISRNAVLGKVHRLGLSHRAETGACSKRIKKTDDKPKGAPPRPRIIPIIGVRSVVSVKSGASLTIRRFPKARELSKTELRAQLMQAVKNTAALDVA